LAVHQILSGIRLITNNLCCVKYADDVSYVIQNDQEFITIQNLLKVFEKVSGIKQNSAKSQALDLQSSISQALKHSVNIQDTMKVLGIVWSAESKHMIDRNGQALLQMVITDLVYHKDCLTSILDRVRFFMYLFSVNYTTELKSCHFLNYFRQRYTKRLGTFSGKIRCYALLVLFCIVQWQMVGSI